MRFLRFLLSVAGLLLFSALPPGLLASQAVTPYGYAVFHQIDANGSVQPVQAATGSGNANQELIVASDGSIGVNPVTRANLSASVIASGAAVSLTTATPKTVTSVALGVGTWQVYGYVDYATTSATTTLFQQGSATTTNSFTNSVQAQDTFTADWNPMTTTSATLVKAIPILQVTVASGTTTVYLVGQATFSAGSATAYGTLFSKQLK